MPPKKQYGTQKAFRFSDTDLAYLEQLVQDVSLAAEKDVTATEVIRGALKIASQADPKEVYGATLQVQIEHLQSELKGEQERLRTLPSGKNLAVSVEKSTYMYDGNSDDYRLGIEEIGNTGVFVDTEELELIIDKDDYCIVVNAYPGKFHGADGKPK